MQPVNEAFEAISGSILPHLSRLLDAAIDSGSLARPGTDAAAYADALRKTAADVAALTELVAAVAPLAQDPEEPRRMSA